MKWRYYEDIRSFVNLIKSTFLMEGNMLLQLWAKKEAFIRCNKGATAIEYGLIAAGIAVAISVAVFSFGTQLAALFGTLSTAITPAA
jgi:pilus assembly protein Flp/PilA